MATTSTPTTKRLNVLVYSGNGTTVDSVRQCLFSLRRLLASNYAVIPVTGEMIINEPWTASCALLVMPGGADLPYCSTLNGAGNRRISQFVQRGGAYLGFCAGGYYGSKRCEFEVGNKKLEVIGDRELAFYPGICRGCAFPGFVYNSEDGARATELQVSSSAFTDEEHLPNSFKSYYNGGGAFVDAPKFADQGVEVLASYTEPISVDSGEGTAAIVYCRHGEGAAILTGPHPEFAAANLDRNADGPEFCHVIDTLAQNDEARTIFLRACLKKLGLRVSEKAAPVPALSRMHLSALEPGAGADLISALQDIIVVENEEKYIKDDSDTFRLERPSPLNMDKIVDALPDTNEDQSGDKIIDYQKIIKDVVVHEEYPSSVDTPCFNHQTFYGMIKEYRTQSREDLSNFGSHVLYAEVVTSTNTLLEKNTQLLRRLPNGFMATANVQVAGRGRGSNVWVSPPGQLMFSICIRHPVEKFASAPVVFIQYLVAMAIVKGIKTYDKGYENMPIKLKWPNDIYALDPSQPDKKIYTKIAGILVNAHFSSREYIAVAGAGINALNSAPTTSLNAILNLINSRLPANAPGMPPLSLEKLLARILTTLEELYTRFLRTGFDQTFEDMYYADWLHMDQIVTLEAEGGVRARIKGITKDYGLLVAEELGWEDRPTGKKWELQSDSNSFDFFKGLVKRKI
ncbi:biotin holocarboxylase synthetase [Ophidiomyces ophidiicola]|uniref:biotin holocarboxylase synthetase n=1 Tax=Ophidiomyces ophidiicola TaxID=1387563 RepID=UPI0020C3B00D|nr:biotin holocarboxylase synthetase [Ophidiomyces ophidiicola]KAI1945323.1 biotin holocarboxylase synthetase [Ophidiomyces ophidiicola]KAI2044795.1 biotin holocarboxylase synthetase [Ophidiomyces ophidiicola]